MGEICVIGGGPAGSTFAARMAQFGHDVVLIERVPFPRPHLGESLSPGVLPLLDASGARTTVEAAGFPRIRNVRVKWGGELQVREDAREQGLLVDRGEFDQLLLQHARSLGVRVLQPARVRQWKEAEGRWLIDADQNGTPLQIRANFVADASGRSSGLNGPRDQTGCRTVALHAYWRGSDLPGEPHIEAGVDRWYWIVPLPDRSYNILVFLDGKHLRQLRSGSLQERFMGLLGKTGLLLGDAQLSSDIQAADATPFLGSDVVRPSMIRVGDAALGIDPVSSSGVQKAIQTALAAAVVANTLLRKPESTESAMRFYRSMLKGASERHCRWAADHYSTVAAQYNNDFWSKRATGSEPGRLPPPPVMVEPNALRTMRFSISPEAKFTDASCLEAQFVVTRPALRHPSLDTPVAFVGGREVVPLLKEVRAGSTLPQIISTWVDLVPPQTGITIAKWLLNNRILIEGTVA